MMRKLMILLLMMAALSAACTPTETVVESDNDGGDSPALEPVTGESATAYPAPATESAAYPVEPAEPVLPTGYPEMTVVAPSGEVDLGSLTPVTPDLTPQVMPSPGRPDATVSPELTPLLEAVARDLNAQTDAPIDEIRLISTEPMVWPNGGLGCPAEGMAYAEVPVEGFLLTLEAAGQTYTYHTAGAREFVLCQNGTPVSSGSVS
jgi:hypothetical protein